MGIGVSTMNNKDIEQLIQAAYDENPCLQGYGIQDKEHALREFLSWTDEEQREEVDCWLTNYDSVIEKMEYELLEGNGKSGLKADCLNELRDVNTIYGWLEDNPLYTLRWSYECIQALPIARYLEEQEFVKQGKISSLLKQIEDKEA